MIVFSCTHCGMKFQVKTQFAGRSTRCPTCKQALVVPATDKTMVVPAGEIEGTSSSLAQAGMDGGVLLEQTAAARSDHQSVRDLLARRTKHSERYVIEKEIARGGMGTVLRGVDCDIRREVAIKYMLDPNDPRKKLRFVEEAQITGQLEHPNIVPIHELGVDPTKRLFFSMKMVKGRSLAQVLDQLRSDPKQADKEFSLARLLNIFVSICNALAYAHSCGVVHRDLKPANVMVGDFGEVYVMDWGLAKVLGDAPAAVETGPAPTASSQSSTNVTSARSSKVQTSRQLEADLTQEGAVLGTPVYMPPEQAAGHIQAIDRQSDVYSLGAILYEMLALLPPIDKEGGYIAVLMRAVQGAIVPPETRNPQRTKAGKVPRELSAIAMKALATQKANRYASVEALRSDIERFQEGRSVTAKQDTMRELMWKMVKRNQAVSAVTAVALVSLAIVWGRSAWNSHLAEKQRREHAKQSVPAFVEAAHFAVERHKFEHALVQIGLAVEYEPENVEARLLKGQLLMVLGDYPAARGELEHYVKAKPDDKEAAQLLQWSGKARRGDASSIAAIADVLRRQNALALAASMVQSREQLLALYRQQINAAWPGLGASLQMDSNGTCTLSVPGEQSKKVTNLQPLSGIPLVALDLRNCPITDLGPVQHLPLTNLTLAGCTRIKDLTPLQGMKLTHLNLASCGEIRDLAPLRGVPLRSLVLWDCGLIKDLTPLREMRLTYLNIGYCRDVRDLAPLRSMPLTTLYLAGNASAANLQVIAGLPLTNLTLQSSPQLTDLSLLRGLALQQLDVAYNPQIKDLTPLHEMPLTSLTLSNCGQTEDLTPLRNLKLTALNLSSCGRIQDLKPLQGMPLTLLYINGCPQVHDVTLLRGMSLGELWLTPKHVFQGMNGLRSMQSLKVIAVDNDKRFGAVEFWKRYDAGEFNK